MGLVFLVNFIAVLLSFCAKDKRFSFCFSIAFLLLAIFYGIRYDFGNDYWGYYDAFVNSKILDFSSAKEPGWHLLMHLCQPMGYFGFIFVLSLLYNLVVYKLIKRNVSRQWWWLAMFVFLFTFNFFLLGLSMIRQYMAMLLCMLAVNNMAENKILKFIIYLVIAGTVHFSSLIVLFSIIFYFIRPRANKISVIIVFVMIFIIMILATNTLSSSMNAVLQMAFMENYSVYSDWDAGTKSVIGISFDIMMMVLTMSLYPQNTKQQIFFWVFLTSFIMQPFSYVLAIFIRLSLYFSIFSVICYPQVFSSIRGRWYSLPLMMFYMLYTFRRCVISYTGETYWEFFNVYKTIFSAPYWI